LKVTKHNVLAVACATLLLTAAVVSGQAHAGDNTSRSARYAQNAITSNGQNSNRQKEKRSSRSTDSQRSNATNGEDNQRNKTERAPGNSDAKNEAQNDAPTVSRSDAAAIAERATGGRVLSVKQSGRYWQVKVLVDDKRVRSINVDMRTGRVL
jgi:uncharacterized membrane protein YkoI